MAVEIDAGPMPETLTGEAQDCPCCGGWPRRAQPVTDRYGWTWGLHTCHACDVQYQARPMTDQARAQFYGSGRYRRLCAAVTGKPWDDQKYLRKQQQVYAETWTRHWYEFDSCGGSEMTPFPCGTWLDYGGSTGVVSRRWKQATGHPVTVTVADYGDGATTTPEQALAVPDATYDAILCCQTLDHLREPLQTLRQFLRVATPGARLFVDVVKLAHTQYKLSHDVYFPTAASFLSLVERSGWDVLWLDAETNHSHYTILAVKP